MKYFMKYFKAKNFMKFYITNAWTDHSSLNNDASSHKDVSSGGFDDYPKF